LSIHSIERNAAMDKIRKAAWAGQFYASDPVQLKSQIKEYLECSAPSKNIAGPLGLIVPHAGYAYSGQTAAAGYVYLQEKNYKTVVIIAPSHAAFFKGISIYDGTSYETPLGTISVDEKIAKLISEQSELLRLSDDGHKSTDDRPEHALEVQLPFLQTVLKDFNIVPIVFHDYSIKNCQTLGQAIASVCAKEDTIVVASSDLYHGYSYKECQRKDNMTLESIQKMDAKEFLNGTHSEMYQACGAGPIASLMKVMKEWGANQIDIIAQTNSADVSGQIGDWTVGYASLVAY
jgi:MEMO1 family protein